MSHFSTIKTEGKLTNAELLVESLKELGYRDVAHHLQAQPMQDHYQLRGKRSRSQSLANIIVPWQSNQHSCSADFGFLERDGEYVPDADDMDTNRLRKKLVELQKLYNEKTISAMEAKIMATAKKLNKGKPTIDRTTVNGTIRLAISFENDVKQYQQTLRR